MDLYLSHQRINLARNVLSTTLTQEETMEMIVPDALPDILKIIDVDATILMRSKDTDNGRVSVSGVAMAVVTYCPEGISGVRKINVDIPFTISAAEAEITQHSKVTTLLSLTSADAAIINPRKFIARVDILADIACYNDTELVVCTDIEPTDDCGVEVLRESTLINAAVDVREKSFIISDEFMLPSSNPPIGEVIKTRISVTGEESKVVGNKLIFRGNTSITVLYLAEETDELISADVTAEFSQIMELENISGECDFDITLMLTGAYIQSDKMDSSDNRSIAAELHAVAQCVAIEHKTIPYISDIYSTKYMLTQSCETLSIENRIGTETINTVVRENLEASEISRVISVCANVGGVTRESGNIIKCPIHVNCLYITEDNRLMCVSSKFDAEAEIASHENTNLTAAAIRSGEVFGAKSGGGIEIRIPIDFIISESCENQICPVSEAAYDEDSPLDTSKDPSLTISRVTASDTLWVLAKKHHSTTELILAANGYESAVDVQAGQMLVIPKKR